ncbi:uncharacterized protein LOC118522376 [Halichoerus grypus]|uniref:uncharacterized protein LOC118522376 n=1 Tax=Halichoerus grypus TaxID=9711 RepID=UPI0016597066|nr:uncharacterized protein LOC118522376 [Halichoerus grypus]XP_035927258.1 uncharacterized protein LOC118522376 [Halichoerus grypus]
MHMYCKNDFFRDPGILRSATAGNSVSTITVPSSHKLQAAVAQAGCRLPQATPHSPRAQVDERASRKNICGCGGHESLPCLITTAIKFTWDLSSDWVCPLETDGHPNRIRSRTEGSLQD